MSQLLKQSKSLEDYFAEYDGDYDGFLTPTEFFTAFKSIGRETGVMDSTL